MKTQTITWTLAALLLVAIVFATPPSGSPSAPTLSDPGFPNSNTPPPGTPVCTDPDDATNGNLTKTTVTCSPTDVNCQDITDSCDGSDLIEAVCDSVSTSGMITIVCPYGCAADVCTPAPPTGLIEVILESPVNDARIQIGDVTYTGVASPVPADCNLTVNGNVQPETVVITKQFGGYGGIVSLGNATLKMDSFNEDLGTYSWNFVCVNETLYGTAPTDNLLTFVEEQVLEITLESPFDGDTMKAEVSNRFSAVVAPTTPELECMYNLTQVGNDTSILNVASVIPDADGVIEFDYLIEKEGAYVWNVTCTDLITVSTKAGFTVDPADAVLDYNYTTKTNASVYNTYDFVEFSATLNADPTGNSCAIYLGEKGSTLLPEAINSAEDLLHVDSFNESGEYRFYFNCSRENDFSGLEEYVKSPTIDFTIRPNISIEGFSPDIDVEQGYGVVRFEVQTNVSIEQCYLQINDWNEIRMNKSGKTAWYEETFTAEDTGIYRWNITCNAYSRATNSRTNKLTILSTPAQSVTLAVDKNSYYPGETIRLTGSRFDTRADLYITLSVEDDNYPIEDDLTDKTGNTGIFSFSYDLDFDSEEGTYTFHVVSESDASKEGIVTFEVKIPHPSIRLNRNVLPNETIDVRGSNFFPDLELTFVVKKGSTKTVDETFDADEDGDFTYSFNAGNVLGDYKVIVTQEDSDLEVSKNFTVLEVLPLQTFYRDADNDGFGLLSDSRRATIRPAGYVDIYGDCNDQRINIHPDKLEVCDGIDNDCDGLVDTGDLCTGSGKECSAGQCKVVQSSSSTSVYAPPPATEPINEQPAEVNPVIPVPNFQDDEESSLLWWILIPLLALILIAGGFVGFVAYEGYLDTSSPGAFIDGVKKSLGIVDPTPVVTSVTVPKGDYDLLSKFITGKRGEGYDDLTIRNSLIKKGWKEAEIDSVFDEIYQ